MRASILTCLIWMLSSASSIANAQLTVANLETQLANGQNVQALMDIYKSANLPNEVSLWLDAKAEEGVPPFQYEVSRRLIATNFEQGVKWYARAFIARSMDLSQCRDKNRNPVRMVIGTLYAPVQDQVLTKRSMYGQALEEAIKWEQSRKTKPTPHWICGSDFIDGEEGEKLRRAKYSENIDDAQRIKAGN